MNLSKTKGFSLIIAIIVLTNIAVLLDIPVLRQVVSFIFLTFIPGFLILSILKLNRLGLVEKTVLSVGLSVAFLMFFGLAVNGLLLAVGYAQPLSTISLLISFSIATIILVVIAFIRNRDITFSLFDLKLTTGGKAFLIVPALFPLISIIGMRIMNLTDSNVLLMVLLFLIPAYVIFISFYRSKAPENVYPAVIFLISISLLLMYALRSNHILGSDTHRTYFMFLTVVDNLRWSQIGFGNLDTCLSITLLPSIYQILLNINPEYLFKLLPSVIVSIMPVAVYLISKKHIGSFYAFLASIAIMSQITFLWTPSFARINIAIFFFALLVFTLFDDNISQFSKRALFIILAATIIVSHYGVTYAAFFALLLTCIGMEILSRIVSRQRKGTAPSAESPPIRGSPSQLERGITLTAIVLFLAMLFFWYSQMTETAFSWGVRFVYDTFAKWAWFLGEGAAGQPVQAAFGMTLPYAGVPQRIEFVFSWLTIILLAIGLLASIRIFKAIAFTPDSEHKRFEAEYLVLALACFGLLVATVVLPYISKHYGASRTFFQMMVPLSVFFVIGGIMLAKYLKSRAHWIILVVLIPYFICTTGLMCQVFGFPRAITLNSEGPLYDSMYVSDGESYAAKWVKEHAEGGIIIHAHHFAQDILTSQGKIPYSKTDARIVSYYESGVEIDGYIYLRYLDITESGFAPRYPDIFDGKSKIYSNAKSQVYRSN